MGPPTTPTREPVHPLAPPVLLAASAVFAAAVAAVTARWRDSAPLALCLGAAALAADPAAAVVALPAPALLVIAAWRGASRGVARPELTALALLVGAAGVVAARAAPAARDGLTGCLVAAGVVVWGLALARRTTVRARPRWVGEVPIERRATTPS